MFCNGGRMVCGGLWWDILKSQKKKAKKFKDTGKKEHLFKYIHKNKFLYAYIHAYAKIDTLAAEILYMGLLRFVTECKYRCYLSS